ncbi:MAG: GntR family transcriptional regulator [Azospirillaceae bacterium]
MIEDQVIESQKQSLRPTVYDAIKNRILTNRLRPGAKLTHQQLAEQLNVSRTPVREALERLFQEGFVTHIPYRGFTVAEITRQEAFELYQMREALETYSVRFAITGPHSALDIGVLENLNDRYLELVEQEKLRKRMLVDRDFHLHIARSTGNEFMVRTLESVFERIILKMRTDGFWTTRGKLAHQEHCRLIDALREGYVEAAVELMSRHIREACDCVLEQIEQAEADVA